MAEAIVGSMLWKLQQVASREARTLVAVNEDIRSLRDKLMWMQAFLRDVQPSRRVQPNELIKVWLQQTRDAVFDAEDAVDQYFVQIDLSRFPRWSRAVFGFFASFTTQIVVRRDLSSRIRLINERLEGIIVNKDRYRLGESTTLGSVWRPSSSTSYLSEKMDDVVLPLVGREALVNDFMDLLYKSSVNVENVITVTGESGVGKTKLVRTLYDKKQTLSHFDIYEWVSFGPNLSASDVLNIIIGNITDGEECEKDKIRDKLKEILKRKKYLFVIDAELSDSEWSRIFRMLDVEDVKAGSRIVRISQSPPHKPPPPYQEKRIVVPTFDDKDDVVINLFKQTFLTYGRDELPEYLDKAIKKYRMKILENTKGLPLAVVLLSGLLRTKEYPNEWNTVFKHLKKMQSKQIDKILSLCFDDLPYDMKSCLLYFAALPVNTFIKARNIVCMWMAEGFLVPKATTVEKVGEQYVKELIDRRLVNLAPVGYDLPGHARVAVQSKVHAFLQLEAQEQCFVEIHSGDDIPALSDARRLSLQNHKDKYAALSHPLPKLRAILSNFEAEQEAPQAGEKPPNEAGGNGDGPCLYQVVRCCPDSSMRGGNRKKKQAKSCVQDLLHNSRFLRVIHFHGLEVGKELPGEIGNVVNLQYIRVTSCSLEKIPSSIDRLCNLQTLDVRGTMVRRLPDGFWRIQTLRHVLGDRLVLPKRVGDLRNLQTLKSIKPDYDGAHAWGSKTFTHMTRLLYLHIRRGKSKGKQDIFSHPKHKAALVKAVATLKYLVVLIIKAPTIPSEVFTGSNLERLQAMELIGKLFLPQNGILDMEVRNRLPNLKKLRLTETMVSQEFINQLRGLQFLSTLELTRNSFRQLIFQDGFPSLKELTVHEEVHEPLDKLEIHESALPKLRDLDILIHSNELRVVIHGHSELVEHIKAEDEELSKVMNVIIPREVQVENNKE